MAPYTEVGAYDAKTKLGEMLREVEQGRRFTITHRGRRVADLVPTATATRGRKAAIAAMLAFEPVLGVADETVAEWTTEGRT